MAYTPKNVNVFIAAYVGAIAGISASLKQPVDATATDYANPAAIAGAFAQSFDTTYNSATPNDLEITTVRHLAYAVFQERSPTQANASVVATWNTLSAALVAILTAGDTYFAAQGVTPPGPSGASALTNKKYIDSGTSTAAASATGAISLPYKTIGAFLTAIGKPLTAASADQLIQGLVSPGVYTESLAFPSYRNQEIRADNAGQVVTGNVTWVNSAGGGAVAPTGGGTAQLNLHNIFITGTLTVTDDGTVPGILQISSDEIDNYAGAFIGVAGTITMTGATNIPFVFLRNVFVQAITSTANATGTELLAFGSTFANFIGATMGTPNQPIESCKLNGTVYTINAGNTINLKDCAFTNTNPVISGGLSVTFDGPSLQSFNEAGGTVTAPMVALCVGGYNGGEIVGAALTDAPLNLAINGVGATAGFTKGGNHYSMAAATLGADRIITLLVAGSLKGDTIKITRLDATAHLLTIKDDAGTTLAIFPNSKVTSGLFTFNGTHFITTDPGVS